MSRCCSEEFGSDVISLNASQGLREILVEGADFKFSCAHFVAFKGFRERMHGHNYTVKVKIGGPINHDGYILDFGVVKASLRRACKALNESFIVPGHSDVLTIDTIGDQIEIRSKETGSFFSLPKSDCSVLPIVHSTAEELAELFWGKLEDDIGRDTLISRSLEWMEVTVFEAPTQAASYRKRFNINTC